MAARRARTAAFVVVGARLVRDDGGREPGDAAVRVYEREFGFSSAVLTLVFATYALVLAPSLLVFGQLSDRLGRRRVMAAGLRHRDARAGPVRARREPRRGCSPRARCRAWRSG